MPIFDVIRVTVMFKSAKSFKHLFRINLIWTEWNLIKFSVTHDTVLR